MYSRKTKNHIEFAQRLKNLMDQKNVTQAVLGDAIDATQGLIGHYLHGRCFPTEDKILKISDFFNVKPEWLRYGAGNSFDIYPQSLDERITKDKKKIDKILQKK